MHARHYSRAGTAGATGQCGLERPHRDRNMAKVILYRLVQFPLILAIIYVLTFLLAWVAPGNPFQSGEKNMDPVVEKMLRERFHADSPWQFLAYYPRQVILHGDLGWSMQYREWPVNRIIHDALPVSITLGLFALLVALLVGVGVGTMAAVYRGGVLDWTSLSITLIGISLPELRHRRGAAGVRRRWSAVCRWAGGGTSRQVVLPGAGAVAGADGVHRPAHARVDARRARVRLTSAPPGPRGCPARSSSGSTACATPSCRCSPTSAPRRRSR